MDLDELDDAVTVWIARVSVMGRDERIVTSWSRLDAAQAWVEHEREVEADLTWGEIRGSGSGKLVEAHDKNGMKIASIQQVEIMDPIELSRQHPLRMPAARTARYDDEEK